ncbi:hypothetical protein [Halobacterium sp. R2-5]|uniref:hypothetical protein n=1 Tax=Halobacterium sp. R2-5 TaxID=2715751 RepID=UPI0014209492|nr:hypothetical protein [Halobacterium sp. R2-5]NIB99401.1 hypothetical protein [Halobacterium sp. R2-5]
MSRFNSIPEIGDESSYKTYVVGFLFILLIVVVIGAIGSGVSAPEAVNQVDAAMTIMSAAPATTTAAYTTEVSAATAAQSATPTTSATGTNAESAENGTSYSFNGSGTDVTDSFTTEGGLVVIDAQHTGGESNFQIQAVSSNGTEEYIVNAIGEYNGTVALHMPSGEWQLDVTADGDWNTNVTQPRYNEEDIENLPASAEDQHAAFYGPFEFEGATEVTFEIENDAHAAVWLARMNGEKVELLHNEIGPYEGTSLVSQQGVGLIVIEAGSADWRIEIGG